jgi:Protein of unknown function (DUF3089)
MNRPNRSRWALAVVAGWLGAACAADPSTTEVRSEPVTTESVAASSEAPSTTITITMTTTTANAPTTVTSSPSADVDYANPAHWICRPDMDDVCDENLAVTDVAADGTLTVRPYVVPDEPAVDCFYAYPTSSWDSGNNSDLQPNEEIAIARVQIGPFSQVCNVYAPVYRSLTSGGYFQAEATKGPDDAVGDWDQQYLDAWDMAYADLAHAWEQYLATDNQGRGVILVGHSQGAFHLARLLTEVVDPDPTQRSLLVGAYLPGTSVAVPEGADVGGALRNIPLCRSFDQIGCVVTFASFDAAQPRSPDSQFGRPWREYARPGMSVGCVNPAAPAGGAAELGSMFESARWAVADGSVTIPTPMMNVPGFATAECVESDGASYLEVTFHPDPVDPRADAIAPQYVGGPVWGLHAADIALTGGSMIAMAAAQIMAYRTQA